MGISDYLLVVAISIIGLGFSISPLHPFTLYENHVLYTEEYAVKITSFQIAVGLIGSLLVPAITGVLMTAIGASAFLYSEIVMIIILMILRYRLVKTTTNVEYK